MTREFIVAPENAGERLDAFLAGASELSRSAAVRAIEEGRVTVNGSSADKKQKLKSGDAVILEYEEVKESEILPEDIPLDVVYEDGDIIVINKPKGMVVHPAVGNYTGTLVNALLFRCRDSLSGVGGVARPGIVHRIDKDTSGLLVVAKNDAAHMFLSELLRDHSISRIYYAVCVGTPKEERGRINKPIGRHKTDRKKMATYASADSEGIREAVTHYRVLASGGGYSLVKFRLETGRTHQIRVHMASIGHPLLGDEVYGGGHTRYEKQNRELLAGQCLCAKELTFRHPRSGDAVHFEVDFPEYMKKVLRDLEFEDAEKDGKKEI